ncbi:hypothetical protein Pst134EA_019039 [Puccinia striiformis f. sp. tritici]|uniref:hypothetical protein n=1 Tax=Puccinia striiformis f. sp. tritici TaxID=168172 RepID=UPI002008A39B|nr:hypothetical protein Pst134EA_019039 [Puccinia striiformis f. sp. tritici]KAH9458885.1 hypothetical protein Pst134EA_019039 [Puccinia striiformis f. sp. tritici]
MFTLRRPVFRFSQNAQKKISSPAGPAPPPQIFVRPPKNSPAHQKSIRPPENRSAEENFTQHHQPSVIFVQFKPTTLSHQRWFSDITGRT